MKRDFRVQNAYRSILQNDFEEALRWFEAAIEADPGDAEIHYRCSITYGRSGKLERAIHHAKEALALQPDKPEYELHLQHVRALELVQQAKRLVESQHPPQEEDMKEAVKLLKSAAVLDPLYPEAYVWLALVYSELNDLPRAISTLKEVIGMYPQDRGLQHLMEELKKRLKSYLLDS